MAAASSPQVLVVEDEPGLADRYSEWLADRYDVAVSYGGEAALSALDETIDVVCSTAASRTCRVTRCSPRFGPAGSTAAWPW